MTPGSFRAGAALLLFLALAVRALEWPLVFPGDGRVWLDPFDGAYRARRALYTFERFPGLLRFDPSLAFPGGAAVPAPPLYDWLLGASGRALGRDPATFERVLAWASPTLSSVTVLPIAAAGRALAGPTLGLGAAALFALLPMSANFARLGDPDHHAAVALLGACLLAQTLALARGARGLRAARLWCGLALARAALVLVWSGSLLYVAVADGVLLALGALAGGCWLAAHAAGLAAGALALAPFAAAEQAAGGAAFTATTFSWLQVAALAGAAAFAGALAALERVAPARGPGPRAARIAALGAFALAALLALPAGRAALAPALAFLARDDAWGPANLEQRPLFPFLTRTPLVHGRPAHALYGAFAWMIPLAPLAALALARDPARRRAALALAGWSGAFGALALAQVRFGSDYAPSGSVALALLVVLPCRALARRLGGGRARERLAAAAACAAGAALLAPALVAATLPAARRALSYQRVPALARAYVERSGAGSLRRFAERVRAVAHDPALERDPFARPSFGVLAAPNFGYALQYFARRATPASNAGPYLDPARYLATLEFFATEAPARALALARALGARYVMTEDHGALEPAMVAYRLQREAGSAEGGRPQLAHFRLLDEGPEDGRPLFFQFRGPPPQGEPPYRLFELVEGAVLTVPAPPGAEASAELALRSPLGRTLAYRARARAGPDGVARLRVPHPTGAADAPVRAAGLWSVRSGARAWRVALSLDEVRGGALVDVAARAAGAAHEAAPPL